MKDLASIYDLMNSFDDKTLDQFDKSRSNLNESNELEKRAKAHKKKQKGISALSKLNPDAGNVEHNVKMFNKVNSPIDGPSNNPISGPFGGDVGGGEAMGESIDESYNVQFYQIFRSPTKHTENGKMVAQAGSEEEAHAKGKELCGAGNYLIKAVCDDGRVRYLECVTESSTPVSSKHQKLNDSIDENSTSCTKIKGLNSIEESITDKDSVELYYRDLKGTQLGPQRDVDDWDEWPFEVDWKYTVDRNDVLEFLSTDCLTDDDYPEAADEWTDEKYWEWLDDNFDTFFDKYEKKILANWEEAAIEDAERNYDPNDYI